MTQVSSGEELVMIKLTIKQLDGEMFVVEVMKDASVLGLKTMIFQLRNVTIDRQRLIYHAQELRENEALLSQFGIIHDSLLHIVIRPISNVELPTIQSNVVVNIPESQYSDEGHMANVNNNMALHDIPQNNEICKLVKRCRFIKIMSITNGVFLCIFSVTSPSFFVLSLLSLTGYIGAKYLKRSYLALFMMCLILDIFFRSWLLYVIHSSTLFILCVALLICIDIFLFKITTQLYCRLPSLSDDMKQQVIHFNRLGLC